MDKIIKTKVTLIKLTEEGLFEKYESIEVDFDTNKKEVLNIPEGYVLESWSQEDSEKRWYTPRYDFKLDKWVESLTDEEIEEYNKPVEEDLNLTTDKKEIIELRKQLEETQQGLVEIMNLISIQDITP